MKLIPAVLKPLGTLCSTNKTRLSLNGIHVQALTNQLAQFEATDGHQALRITQLEGSADPNDFPTLDGLPVDQPDTSAIVPAPAWTAMFTGIPTESRSRSLPIIRYVAYTSQDHTVTVGTTDLQQRHVQTVTPIEGTFPNLEACMPKQPATMTAYFNVHLLAQVFGALSKMLPTGYNQAVRLDLYGAEQPMRITALDCSLALHYTGLVMPMRQVQVADNIPLTPPTPTKENTP